MELSLIGSSRSDTKILEYEFVDNRNLLAVQRGGETSLYRIFENAFSISSKAQKITFKDNELILVALDGMVEFYDFYGKLKYSHLIKLEPSEMISFIKYSSQYFLIGTTHGRVLTSLNASLMVSETKEIKGHQVCYTTTQDRFTITVLKGKFNHFTISDLNNSKLVMLSIKQIKLKTIFETIKTQIKRFGTIETNIKTIYKSLEILLKQTFIQSIFN
jgi:Fe2+ or Zn2+ uptake regulation protein